MCIRPRSRGSSRLRHESARPTRCVSLP
jgi:hypothetical protein